MQLFNNIEESLINNNVDDFKLIHQLPKESEFMNMTIENINHSKNNYIKTALIYLMGKCVHFESTI